MRTRVKICGITCPEDALVAVKVGADAIGLVFYPPSPRYVELEQAVEIVASLPPFVTTVGLFVDADAETIAEVVNQVNIDLIQFHGNESADYCAQHARPWIRALRVQKDTDVAKEIMPFSAARGILLDAYRPDVPGGTGETFDWSLIPQGFAQGIVLAGGLDADNVAQAVRQVHPYAVDVSSGVEAAPGIKDTDKMARFMESVRSGEVKQ